MGRSMILTSCSITGKMNAAVSKDLGDLSNLADPTANPVIALAASLTDGRGSGQANSVYYDSKQLGTSASQDYDLVGTLTNAFGDTVNLDLVKTIIVNNTGTAASNGSIRVIAQTFSSWCKNATDYIIVKPGGCFLLHAPDTAAYDMSAGSDTLRITNESGSVVAKYEIGIIGVEIDSSSSSSSSSSSTNSSSSSSTASSSSSSSSSSP